MSETNQTAPAPAAGAESIPEPRVLTTWKGVRRGEDFVRAELSTHPEKGFIGISRILTGTTREDRDGVFAHGGDTDLIALYYGDKRITIAELEAPGCDPLGYELSTEKYVSIVRSRIEQVRAWVARQDFEDTISIQI